MDGAATRQARRDRLNNRKTALTAESSARWANAIIAANDDQYRLARDAQYRHIIGLQAAIATIEKRLAATHRRHPHPRAAQGAQEAKLPKGYPTQAERFAKQRRLQELRAELGRVCADRDSNRVRVIEGGKRLAKTRHNLDAAGLTVSEWRQQWECARYRIEANGSGDEPFGNLTITVTPDGQVSLRLPQAVGTPRQRQTRPLRAVRHARCFPTGPTSGGRGSPAAVGVLHDHPQTRPGRPLPHRLLGHPRQRLRLRRRAERRDGDVRRTGRSSGWTSTTGTWRCAVSTSTATRSGNRRASTSTCPAPAPAATPRSATPSPG